MVVMPEYIVSTTKQNPNKPRIISEVKKNCLTKLKLSFTTSLQDFGKSKFSGQLLWNIGNSEWVLRSAEVRQGSLILINKQTSQLELRLPLRELNLRPCNAPKTFCLTEAEGVRLFVFQALTEEDYEKWVRILAVELIRQTPFQNVRFLDILSIIRSTDSDKTNLRRGRSEECLPKIRDNGWECSKSRFESPPKGKQTESKGESLKRSNLIENKIEISVDGKENNNNNYKINDDGDRDFRTKKVKITNQNSLPVITEKGNKFLKKVCLRAHSVNNLAKETDETLIPKELSDESGISSGDENPTDPTARNVDNFSFLSVRERKKFFESLNSGPEIKWSDNFPLVRSNSIGNFKQSLVPDRNRLHKRKRTKSLHDLHKTPVREICQIFETWEEKTENNVQQTSETIERNAVVLLNQRRLQRGERKLEKIRNQIAEVEDTIKLVEEDIKSIGTNTLKRREGLEIFAALQRRLGEENSRLERLKEETTRVIKGNQRTIMKLERYNEKR